MSTWWPLLVGFTILCIVTLLAMRERRRAAALKRELDALSTGLLASTRLASLGNLVAGLVHEINTPIGALSSNHDVIKRALGKLQSILADEQVEAHELAELRKIVRALDGVIDVNTMAVERVDKLVTSLRQFGRPDRSEIAWADLHEGLDSTLAIIQHQLNGIEVICDYGELPRVLCRPQQINQVFMNLLVNACQASTAGGRLTIRTEHNNHDVRVTIADTGSGIAPEHRNRIFDPGFTTKGSRVGMGMGLLITRQIVEQHEGTIELESAVGVGTKMIVTLPVSPAALQRQQVN